MNETFSAACSPIKLQPVRWATRCCDRSAEPLPLITASYEELMGMSIKELKAILGEQRAGSAGTGLGVIG